MVLPAFFGQFLSGWDTFYPPLVWTLILSMGRFLSSVGRTVVIRSLGRFDLVDFSCRSVCVGRLPLWVSGWVRPGVERVLFGWRFLMRASACEWPACVDFRAVRAARVVSSGRVIVWTRSRSERRRPRPLGR